MRRVGAALVLSCVGACAPAGGGRAAPTWQTGPGSGAHGDEAAETLDVDPIDTSEGGPLAEGDAEAEGGDEGFDCDGEGARECMCPDGTDTGVQFCESGMWGHCACPGESTGAASSDGGASSSDDGGDEGSSGEPEPLATEVCYPGEDNAYTTCFPLSYFDPEAPPVGYEYPDALADDPNYRRPLAYLDLDAIDPAVAVSPNFNLGELAQAVKGRWGIVQPHAVEKLQGLRDAAGPLLVNSGYRSPDYNATVDGATWSRHLYGDGFDLDPAEVSIDMLEIECTGAGGTLVEYETHVHCDWRDVEVDTEFFGPADAAAPDSPPPLGAELRHHGPFWWAPATGFDEGEPVRRWTARGPGGELLLTARGPLFAAPPGTATIELELGRAIERVAAADP
jgi:Peptidase M15